MRTRIGEGAVGRWLRVSNTWYKVVRYVRPGQHCLELLIGRSTTKSLEEKCEPKESGRYLMTRDGSDLYFILDSGEFLRHWKSSPEREAS